MSLVSNAQKLAELEKLIGPSLLGTVLDEVKTAHKEAEAQGLTFKETGAATSATPPAKTTFKMEGDTPDLAKMAEALAVLQAQITSLQKAVEETEGGETEEAAEEEAATEETEMETGEANEDEDEEGDETTTKELDGLMWGDVTVKEAIELVSGVQFDTVQTMIEQGLIATPAQVTTKESAYLTSLKEVTAPILTTLKELAGKVSGLEAKVALLAGEQPRGTGYRASADPATAEGANTLKEQSGGQGGGGGANTQKTPEQEAMENLAAGLFPAWTPPA